MLPHLACRLFGTPLLVQRAKLDVILAALGPRLGLDPLPPPELAVPAARGLPAAPTGIAVIPVHGTLVKRTLGLEAASGLTSYAEIGAQLEAALTDPGIGGIVLDIDSPGGEAAGVFELARRVRAAAAVKPVWAVANDAAYSAAYAIAAGAARLYLTETGGVGSIGVIALHVDQSVKDAKDGLTYTAITAGAHKNDYSPHAPLSESAQASLQAEVDRLYGIFVEHVATLRGLDADVVRATEAALYFGAASVQTGLADGLQTLEATLTEMQSLLATSRSRNPARAARSGSALTHKESPMQEETTEMIGVDQAAVLVAEARREVAQSAQAIAELCLIAGCPERAASFIAEGASEAQVRRTLIDARAAASDAHPIRSTITPEAGTESPVRPEASPVVAAVKRLNPGLNPSLAAKE